MKYLCNMASRLIILFFAFLHHSSSLAQPFWGEWSGGFANNKMSVDKPFAAKLLFKKDLNGKLKSYSVRYYKIKENIKLQLIIYR